MTKSIVVTSADAAYMIHDEIGPLRDWHSTLNKMRSDRGDYCELVLKPIGVVKQERTMRPVYLYDDVRNFIDEARVRSGSKAAPKSISQISVQYDPSDKREWQDRKFKLFP